jgi:hypothetical protein
MSSIQSLFSAPSPSKTSEGQTGLTQKQQRCRARHAGRHSNIFNAPRRSNELVLSPSGWLLSHPDEETQELERMLRFFEKSNLEAPTDYTEDPNLFSEMDCNLLGLGETFGVR